MFGKFTSVAGFLLVALASCMRTTRLGDNVTRVPIKTSLYKNRAKFDSSVLQYIDTSVVYEEYDSYNKVLCRLDTSKFNDYYHIYRFYPNGFMNCFVIERNVPLITKELDPEYNGYRGIYYMKRNKIKGELFTVVSGIGTMGKRIERFVAKGDTLIMIFGEAKHRTLYVKRKLSPEYFQNAPTWDNK